MIVIRKFQMDTFEARRRAGFLDDIVAILRQCGDSSRSALPDEVVRQEVEILAQKAEAMGLRSLESVGLFIAVAQDIGWDFSEISTLAGEVLNCEELDEESKRIWLEKWYQGIMESEY